MLSDEVDCKTEILLSSHLTSIHNSSPSWTWKVLLTGRHSTNANSNIISSIQADGLKLNFNQPTWSQHTAHKDSSVVGYTRLIQKVLPHINDSGVNFETLRSVQPYTSLLPLSSLYYRCKLSIKSHERIGDPFQTCWLGKSSQEGLSLRLLLLLSSCSAAAGAVNGCCLHVRLCLSLIFVSI